MVYSHRRENSSSALSFTSSTASATGASFASNDDPSGYSSLVLSVKNILESVYRCDSAAVIDNASTCGSVANQALYQGVEVILKNTANCKNYGVSRMDSVKESCASKPFFEYQCFCDDDDFIVNEECYEGAKSIPNNREHVRAMSNVSNITSASGEDRNEKNPLSLLMVEDDNDDLRHVPPEEPQEEAVIIRKSKWTAHTKSFYSKISSPTQRDVTTIRDVSPPISPRRRPMAIETEESVSTSNDKKTAPLLGRQSRKMVPESREP